MVIGFEGQLPKEKKLFLLFFKLCFDVTSSNILKLKYETGH